MGLHRDRARASRRSSVYCSPGRTLRRRAARAILAGTLIAVWTLITGPAEGATLRHGAAHDATHGDQAKPVPPPGHHAAVLVLLPPYAVYAASMAGHHPSVQAHGSRHIALGLSSAPEAQSCVPSAAIRHAVAAAKSSHVPAAVDLSRYDPPVADEGPLHAGAAWATAYALLGWWAAKNGLAGAPFAPMYVYAQLAGGKNRPVAVADALALEQRQGTDTQADYRQGRTDYRHQPTALERANAARHRIAGYECVYSRRHAPFSAQSALTAVLAGGQPAVLGVPVYDNMLTVSSARPFVDLPPRGAKVRGAEAVVAVKYDKNGLWVQNQWGAGWGAAGYAELSWPFVNKYVWEAWAISVGKKAARSAMRRVAVARPAHPQAASGVGSATATPPAATACVPPSPTSEAMTSPTAGLMPSPSPTPTDTADITPCATSTPSYPTDANASATDLTPYPTYPADVTDVGAYPTAAAYPTYPTDTGFPTSYPTDTGFPADLTPYPTSSASSPTDTPTDTSTAPTSTPLPTQAPGTPTSSPTVSPQVADLPTSGPPGGSVSVAGEGFGPGQVDVYWDGGPVGLAYTDGDRFSLTITVPATATPGIAFIDCLNPGTNVVASTTFTVTAPSASSTPTVPTPTPPASPTPTPPATATATASDTPTPPPTDTPPPTVGATSTASSS